MSHIRRRATFNPTDPLLFLELGNTTIKLARALDDETLIMERFADSAALLKRLSETSEQIVCAPVGERHHTAIAQLERRDGVTMITRAMLARFVAGSYDTPETLGLDRVLNLIGLSSDGVVVSCGTAITVDARNHGRAHWGAIMPGFMTATAGLHERIPALPRIDIERMPSMPARTSIESVVNGVLLGTAGGASDIADQLALRVAPNVDLQVTLTGGDAQIMERLWPVRSVAPIVDEMLLFAGMAAVIRERDAT